MPNKGRLERQRSIKDAYTVDRLRRAQAITDAVFAEVLPLVVPSVTGRVIDRA